MAEDHTATARYSVDKLGFEAVKRYRIKVVGGCEPVDDFVFDESVQAQVSVGSSVGCEIHVQGGGGVSRRHARLTLTTEGLRIRDLGSTNGTLLNGIRVVDAYARAGDVLRLGSVTVQVDEDGSVMRPITAERSFGAVKGSSLAMRRLYPIIEGLAQSSVPFVVEGERGTGKATVATAIHERGPRADGPLVFWDCSSAQESEQEEILFGHERSTEGGELGICEQAHGGTLVLEEVSSLSSSLQGRLLRMVERGTYHHVGSPTRRAVDVRMVTLSSRNLGNEVDAGRLREDVYLRLATVRLELPPLREREGDVPLLMEALWKASGRTTPLPASLLDRSIGHTWPGNIRELEVFVRRYAAMGDALADGPPGPRHTQLPTAASLVEPFLELDSSYYEARRALLESFEGQYMARLLRKTGGNVSLAARISGLPRRSLYIIKNRVSVRAEQTTEKIPTAERA